MTSTSATPTYDPASTAAALASKYTSGMQDRLTAQTKAATASASALASLKSALTSFQASLSALTTGKTLLSRSATLSNSALGSATATSAASAGTYSFFVQQLASAHQVSYGGLDDSSPSGGTLGISLGGSPSFTVDLGKADTDNSGSVSARELALAINADTTNGGKVAASIVTVGGKAQLVLSAKATGLANAITLDTINVTTPGALVAADPKASIKTIAPAANAIVFLGGDATTGVEMQQATNTYTNIDGVSLTFSKAQTAGESAVTLTVGTDSGATTANVQRFIDAYNTLKTSLDGLTDGGDPAKGRAAGALAGDAGIQVLDSRLVSMLRPGSGSDTLASYGILAGRDGKLSINQVQFTRALALRPTGLDALIGSSAAGAPSGLAGSLDSYLKQWSNPAAGQLQQRLNVTTKTQADLTSRQATLDKQYDSAYQRYLMQFTKLQTLQSQMANNTSMFDALFGNKSNN